MEIKWWIYDWKLNGGSMRLKGVDEGPLPQNSAGKNTCLPLFEPN